MKETRSDLNPMFAQKHNYHHRHVFLKLTVSCLLVGLTIRLLFTDSFSLSSVVHNPPPLANAIAHSPLVSFPPPPSYSVDFPVNQTQTSPQGNNSFHVCLQCSKTVHLHGLQKCVFDLFIFSTKPHASFILCGRQFYVSWVG